MTMHRQLDIVDLNLRNMPHLELGHFVIGLADAFGVHAGYQAQGAIPPPLPKIDELRQIGNNYVAAKWRRRVATATRSRSVMPYARRPSWLRP